MSFATRCTACGTIFRVVPDQLKVSDGWVRCGRCDAVFDAASGLFDLEQEAPPQWQSTAPPAAEVPASAPVGAVADNGPFQSEDERRWSASMAAQGLAAEGDAEPVAAPQVPSAPALPPQPPAAARTAFEPASRFDAPAGEVTGTYADEDEDHDAIVITDHPSSLGAGAAAVGAPDASARGVLTEADAAPAFLRRARREASWQSGRARALLGLSALMLVVALALQVTQHDSELMAARWPALRPALTAWCGLSRCSLGAPRRIDDIVVESTALSPVAVAAGGSASAAMAAASVPAAGPSALRLAVTLRNRAGYAVALPSIDLSLTDISGKLIARRALSPADFQAAVAAVPAATELPLQAVLTTAGGSTRVAGYTVEIFYP